MIEIERKFLVLNDSYKALAISQTHIRQGYIPSSATVRIRLRDNEGFLTVKGPSSANGLSRLEVEKPLTKAEAEALFTLCDHRQIDKTRWLIPNGQHTIEVDEFHGANEGLVLAEIELSAEDEVYDRPSFLGEEVTGDPRYYNSYIAQHPLHNTP